MKQMSLKEQIGTITQRVSLNRSLKKKQQPKLTILSFCFIESVFQVIIIYDKHFF